MPDMSIRTMIERLLCALAILGSGPLRSEPVTEVVVQNSAAVPAIERILNADNLDVARLSPREVADAMAEIPRGRAPDDFWTAYQLHVRAWQDYADARDAARVITSPTDIDHRPDGAAIEDARKRINSTFDEVETIARRYHARIPSSSTRT
jgi:hypothetical protein